MTTGNGKFEQDLKQVEDGYRSIPGEEPPDLLDQAVLNKARLAVQPALSRPWSFGWIHATATVALLVLVLSIVLQQPSRLDAPPEMLDRTQALPTESVRVEGNRSSDELSTSGEIKRDASAVLEENFEDQAPVPETVAVGSSMKVSASKQREDLAKQAAKEETGFREAEPARNEPAESAADTPSDEMFRQRRATEDTDRYQAGQAEAGADEPAQAQDKPRGVAAAASPVIVTTSSDPADLRANEADALVRDLQFSVDDSALEHPDEWISRILDMKHRGADEEWKAELELFRASYPDYPLPEELNIPADQEPGEP